MLVLTRKVNEKVKLIIPPCLEERVVEIEVTKVIGNRTSIGIEAPKDIRIIRDELKQYETQTTSS